MGGSKPAVCLLPNWHNIPIELQALPQWLLWRWELRGDTWTKPPFQLDGQKAKSDDPGTWSSFEFAQTAFDTSQSNGRPFDGVGFTLTAQDPFAGFDFDNCLDANLAITGPRVAELVARLDSYTEVSPSGAGLRVIVRAKLPPQGRKRGDFECYDERRYLTITGQVWPPGSPAKPVADRQAEAEAVHTTIFETAEHKTKTSRNGNHSSNDLGDLDLLERARKAKNGAAFAALFDDGAWQAEGFASQSEADLALCSKLAFWTGCNAARIDALFRRSALYREKWDRTDYRERTIAQAIEQCGEVYTPRAQASTVQTGSAQADDADDEPEPPERLSDIALSNEFVRRGGDDFRYVDQLSRWYKYDPAGGRWVEDRKLRIYTDAKRFLTQVSREVKDAMEEAAAAAEKDGEPAKAQEIRKAARGTCRALTSASKVHAVVTLTRSHARVAMLPEQFDKDVFLLNTPDGVVNLKTGRSRPAQREDYFTKTTPVASRDEPTPVFDEFMRDIMGWHIKPADCRCAACAKSVGQPDEARVALHREEVDRLVAYQLRVYGYSLTGDVSEHKLFLQVGPGGNGKGTLNDFMRNHIHGRQPDGYATEIPIEALLESRNERHPTDLMSLWHARLAFARESDETSRWNESRVKRLTGGDPIKARYMRQDFIEFDATHKMIVFVNVAPVLRGADEAAWKRRLELTLFRQVYADKADDSKGIRKRDRQLGEKLEKEAAGVLFKLIKACAKWYQERTLEPPATVLDASDEYLHSQSSMRAFLDETCTRGANLCVSANDLYPVYLRWCEQAHEHPEKRTKFNPALERTGIRVERTKTERGLCWGLQVKPEWKTKLPEPEPPDTRVDIN